MTTAAATCMRWIALTIVVLWCGERVAAASSAQGWVEHRNPKYGFSLQYPADVFSVERVSEAGDGQIFVSADGRARLLVGALVNSSGFSPARYQEHLARHSYGTYQISYRRLAGNWFVLSGAGNGKVFYEKVMFSCSGRLINSVALLYPEGERDVFDPLIARIEASFHPGHDCEHAGLPPAPTDGHRGRRPNDERDALADRLAPAPADVNRGRRLNDERDALADRIARARGHDVLVVLRRTSPPYDYKVVRGYANR